jgi:hypothetical protein
MRRRFVLLLGMTASVALLGGPAIVRLAPRPRIDRDTAEQIQVGMTATEVERLIGAPPGRYSSTGPPWHVIDPGFPGIKQEWDGDGGLIAVWLDEGGAVVRKEFFMIPRGHEPLVMRVRRWLGL